MIWDDKGFLLSKNKYNENSSIAEFFTENNGKIVAKDTDKKRSRYYLENFQLQ